MTVPEWARETTAKYHFHYLHELLRYNKIRYSKNKPDYIASNEYFNGIVERIDTTNHLKTFRDFYDYLSRGTTCK